MKPCTCFARCPKTIEVRHGLTGGRQHQFDTSIGQDFFQAGFRQHATVNPAADNDDVGFGRDQGFHILEGQPVAATSPPVIGNTTVGIDDDVGGIYFTIDLDRAEFILFYHSKPPAPSAARLGFGSRLVCHIKIFRTPKGWFLRWWLWRSGRLGKGAQSLFYL